MGLEAYKQKTNEGADSQKPLARLELKSDVRSTQAVHDVLSRLTADDLAHKQVRDTLVNVPKSAQVVDLTAYRERRVMMPEKQEASVVANDNEKTLVFVRKEAQPVSAREQTDVSRQAEKLREKQQWLEERNRQLQTAVVMIRDLRAQIAQAQAEEQKKSVFTKGWGRVKSWFGGKSEEYTPPDIFLTLRARFTQFDDQELRALIKNTDQVTSNPNLSHAMTSGGEKVLDATGQDARVYSLGLVGEGGIAQVKDAVIQRDDQLVTAVVKRAHREAITGQDVKKDTDAHSLNQAREQAFAVEAWNAQRYLRDPIPYVVRPLLVSQRQPGQVPMIAYEKVTDDRGKTSDFDTVAFNDNVPPSQKFAVFSYAADGLAELHKRGLVHMDFKPGNVMMDKGGKVKIIDPGSMFSIEDQIALTPGSTPQTSFVTKTFEVGGKRQEINLGYTPGYYDVAQIAKSQELGLSLRDADRRALGMSLLDLLAGSQLIPSEATDLTSGFTERAAFNASYLRRQSGIEENIFPPPSARDMYRLAHSLINYTDGRPQLPLDQVAMQIRQLAQRMSKEIDPIFKRVNMQPSQPVMPYLQAA